jgi:hypothetical protein
MHRRYREKHIINITLLGRSDASDMNFCSSINASIKVSVWAAPPSSKHQASGTAVWTPRSFRESS